MHDAAVAMLHGLAVGVDLDEAVGDERPAERREQAPRGQPHSGARDGDEPGADQAAPFAIPGMKQRIVGGGRGVKRGRRHGSP
ncbi:MAG: hypothetical protein ABJD97_00320 [Betaproteobacteria bacterium]